MTRIVGGVAGGRRLSVPSGSATRPTADRTREGLFSSLTSLLGDLRGCRFADLYAGTGAVGLEALSRGAAHALLVESQPRTLRILRANVAQVGLPGALVRAEKVSRVVAEPPDQAYDVVFLDPPYAADVADVLAQLVVSGWLATGAVVAVERSSRDGEVEWPQGLAAARTRRYGDTTLWYGRGS